MIRNRILTDFKGDKTMTNILILAQNLIDILAQILIEDDLYENDFSYKLDIESSEIDNNLNDFFDIFHNISNLSNDFSDCDDLIELLEPNSDMLSAVYSSITEDESIIWDEYLEQDKIKLLTSKLEILIELL